MKRYLLITIDRYDIADSSIEEVTPEVLSALIRDNNLVGVIEEVQLGWEGADSEEVSWLWQQLPSP